MALGFAAYDKRHYRTTGVLEGYRLWSRSYDQMMTDDLDLVLLRRLTSVDFRVGHAIDLACGTGRIGAWLASMGARIIDGVDLCPEMLAGARARGIYRELREEDIRHTSLAGGQADLVINVLSVEHLPSLDPFYAELARLGRPGGTAVIVGFHPHFMLNGIPTHFDLETGESIAIENTIHLFSDHVAAGRRVGFQLLDLQERLVDGELLTRSPGWQRHAGLPASFVL
ncbi:MAG: class I SAM-dependent methyltransferase, partial [Myxococcales bacterium]|nr:class I SAM-dependent methyltransferase [Myxococcales bacterium]